MRGQVGRADDKLRSALQALFPKVATFVEEFHSGKPAGPSGGDATGTKPIVKDHAASTAASAACKGANSTAAKAPAAATKAPGASSGRTIQMKETFYASAHP